MNVIKPIFLAAIGPIDVYHYGDYLNNQPTNVYWQHTQQDRSFGPFISVEEAVSHFNTQPQPTYPLCPVMPILKSQVIHVDFKSKKRLS